MRNGARSDPGSISGLLISPCSPSASSRVPRVSTWHRHPPFDRRRSGNEPSARRVGRPASQPCAWPARLPTLRRAGAPRPGPHSAAGTACAWSGSSSAPAPVTLEEAVTSELPRSAPPGVGAPPPPASATHSCHRTHATIRAYLHSASQERRISYPYFKMADTAFTVVLNVDTVLLHARVGLPRSLVSERSYNERGKCMGLTVGFEPTRPRARATQPAPATVCPPQIPGTSNQRLN